MYFYVNAERLEDQLSFLRDELRQIRELHNKIKIIQVNPENRRIHQEALCKLERVERCLFQCKETLERLGDDYRKFSKETSQQLEDMIHQVQSIFS